MGSTVQKTNSGNDAVDFEICKEQVMHAIVNTKLRSKDINMASNVPFDASYEQSNETFDRTLA